MVEISTSILSVEKGNEAETFMLLEKSKTDYFHIDVMDGKFVSQDTYHKMIEYSNYIKRISNLPLDIHLMVEDVETGIEVFSADEPNIITFHLEACKNKSKADEELIGEYRGFKMLLSFDTLQKQFNMTLKNEYSYHTALGTDVFGNITRLNNTLEGIEGNIKYVVNDIEFIKRQIVNAKIELDKPFEKENEIKEKTKRLQEINIELGIDENEKQVMDEPENDELEKENKEKNLER